RASAAWSHACAPRGKPERLTELAGPTPESTRPACGRSRDRTRSAGAPGPPDRARPNRRARDVTATAPCGQVSPLDCKGRQHTSARSFVRRFDGWLQFGATADYADFGFSGKIL